MSPSRPVVPNLFRLPPPFVCKIFSVPPSRDTEYTSYKNLDNKFITLFMHHF